MGLIKCSIAGESCSKIAHIPLLPVNQVFYSYSVEAEKDELGKGMLKLIQELVEDQEYEFCSFRHTAITSREFFCEKICLPIRRSAILVADLSWYDKKWEKTSPNVAHEVGLAQGIGREVILVRNTATKLSSILSNISGLQVLTYPTDFEGKENKFSQLLHKQKLSIFPEIKVLHDALSLQEFSKRLEKFSGERMFVSSYIPSMTRSRDLTLGEAKQIYPFQDDLPYLTGYLNLTNQRREILEHNLSDNIKCREIYCKPCIEVYVRTGRFHQRSPRKDPYNEVAMRLETLIARLEKYDEKIYSVRLLEEEPLHKFFLKKNSCVIVDTPTRRIGKEAGGMITTFQPVVETYEKIFEDLWGNGKEWNNKKVQEWLEDLLEKVKAQIKMKKTSK